MATSKYIAPAANFTEQIGDSTHNYLEGYVKNLYLTGIKSNSGSNDNVEITPDGSGITKINSITEIYGDISVIPSDSSSAVITIAAPAGQDAEFNLSANIGTTNSDAWQMKVDNTNKDFNIGVWDGAAYDNRLSIASTGAVTINQSYSFPTAIPNEGEILKNVSTLR